MLNFQRRLHVEHLENRLVLDAQLVADLTTVVTNSSNPEYVATIDDDIVFVAEDESGVGLWISDGTESGTQKLASGEGHFLSFEEFGSEPLNPASSRENQNLGYFYESSTDAAFLWATDGSPAGTIKLGEANFLKPIVTGDRAFFWRGEAPSIELWVTEGTTSSTKLLITLATEQVKATAVGNNLYFVDDAGQHWRSDGTVAGTQAVTYESTPSPIRRLYGVGDTVFAFGPDSLWALPAGSDQWNYQGEANPHHLQAAFANHLVYSGTAGHLFMADGALNNPRDLGDYGAVQFIQPFADRMIVGSFDGEQLSSTIWSVSDSGQRYELAMLANETVVAAIGFGDVTYIYSTQVHPSEFSIFYQPTLLYSVWQLEDGIIDRIAMHQEYDNEGIGNVPSRQALFSVANGMLIYRASDFNHGRELWVTGGSSADPRLVTDIHAGLRSSNPHAATWLGEQLLFFAEDDNSSAELFVTDGSLAGTQMVSDIHPGFGSSKPEILATTESFVYLSAKTGIIEQESVYATDGTETFDVMPGYFVNHVTPWRDGVLAAAIAEADVDDESLVQLVYIQGHDVTKIRQGSFLFTSLDGSRDDGMAMFLATNAESELELWAIESPTFNLRLIQNLGLIGHSASGHITSEGNSTYVVFQAVVGFGPVTEIWFTDGTANGTQLLDLGTQDWEEVLVAEGNYYFMTFDDSYHLHRTDPLGQIEAVVSMHKRPTEVHVIDGVVYLEFNRRRTGIVILREEPEYDTIPFGEDGVLYRADGTENGTMLLADKLIAKYKFHVHRPRTSFFVGDDLYMIRDDPSGQATFWKLGDDGTTVEHVADSGVRITSVVETAHGYAYFGGEGQDGQIELYKLRLGHPTGWHNSSLAADVDGDELITPQDVIVIINELIKRDASEAGTGVIHSDNEQSDRYLDVNDDGFIAASDAVAVINDLIAHASPAALPLSPERDFQRANVVANGIDAGPATSAYAPSPSFSGIRQFAVPSLPRRPLPIESLLLDRLFAEEDAIWT